MGHYKRIAEEEMKIDYSHSYGHVQFCVNCRTQANYICDNCQEPICNDCKNYGDDGMIYCKECIDDKN